MILTNEDLYKNQYDYETLKANIYYVSLIDILKTQKLTADFCIKYILNDDFHLSDEDKRITIEKVKKYQPHISKKDWMLAQMTAHNKMLLRLKIDSIEDIESYMNRNNK